MEKKFDGLEPEQRDHIINSGSTEEVSVKFNGVELVLCSSKLDAFELCDLALQVYKKLKEDKGERDNPSYT